MPRSTACRSRSSRRRRLASRRGKKARCSSASAALSLSTSSRMRRASAPKSSCSALLRASSSPSSWSSSCPRDSRACRSAPPTSPSTSPSPSTSTTLRRVSGGGQLTVASSVRRSHRCSVSRSHSSGAATAWMPMAEGIVRHVHLSASVPLSSARFDGSCVKRRCPSLSLSWSDPSRSSTSSVAIDTAIRLRETSMAATTSSASGGGA
mmetsp:Transcript_3367/g.7067  ORF Transcript_3367/g.7067 Transcript_3367/m.7067 type:complete len:208 (-) Transcript_3367:98-721(-)